MFSKPTNPPKPATPGPATGEMQADSAMPPAVTSAVILARAPRRLYAFDLLAAIAVHASVRPGPGSNG